MTTTEPSQASIQRQLFRTLSREEIIDFRRWVRAHYSHGEPVPAIWHPISRQEAETMNVEQIQLGDPQ